MVSTFSPEIGAFEIELEPGQYFTIKENGKELQNLRQVNAGDELITHDNMHYRVEKVEGEQPQLFLWAKRT